MSSVLPDFELLGHSPDNTVRGFKYRSILNGFQYSTFTDEEITYQNEAKRMT